MEAFVAAIRHMFLMRHLWIRNFQETSDFAPSPVAPNQEVKMSLALLASCILKDCCLALEISFKKTLTIMELDPTIKVAQNYS